jgi:SRSO17 transposase
MRQNTLVHCLVHLRIIPNYYQLQKNTWHEGLLEEANVQLFVPDDLTFRTKPQIALALIRTIEQTGLFKAKWIGMDCLYGNSKEFIEAENGSNHSGRTCVQDRCR